MAGAFGGTGAAPDGAGLDAQRRARPQARYAPICRAGTPENGAGPSSSSGGAASITDQLCELVRRGERLPPPRGASGCPALAVVAVVTVITVAMAGPMAWAGAAFVPVGVVPDSCAAVAVIAYAAQAAGAARAGTAHCDCNRGAAALHQRLVRRREVQGRDRGGKAVPVAGVGNRRGSLREGGGGASRRAQ